MPSSKTAAAISPSSNGRYTSVVNSLLLLIWLRMASKGFLQAREEHVFQNPLRRAKIK